MYIRFFSLIYYKPLFCSLVEIGEQQKCKQNRENTEERGIQLSNEWARFTQFLLGPFRPKKIVAEELFLYCIFKFH